jgi:integrase/recombinase XerC
MGSVFKKTTTKPLPCGATVLTQKGRKVARWQGRGRQCSAPVNDTGTRIVVVSQKWFGTVNGRHVPLCRDKQSAEQMLKKLTSDFALASVGLADPFASHKRATLGAHLADYAERLKAKGNTPAHVKQTIGRIRALFDGCEFSTTADLDAGRAAEWLNTLRRPMQLVGIPHCDSFTPAAVAATLDISGAGLRALVKRSGLTATGQGRARRYTRATVEALAERMTRGCGPETVNHYIRAVRGFLRWMLRAKRLGSNPLDALSLLNAQADVRRVRRELTADELPRLLAAARNSNRTFRGLTGWDRFYLYLTAATTGFRANALANLTPNDFDLVSDSPTVTLAARFNKSRKAKIQPLPTATAKQLRGYLPEKPIDSPVWGGSWAADHRGAEMLRIDLAAACIPYEVEGPDGPEYADFHALRHTFLTLGGRSGIDLRTLQELAGHSKPELTARYSHRRLYDLVGAVEMLPNITPEGTEFELRATGTDGAKVCTQFARTAVPGSHPVSPAGVLNRVEGHATGNEKPPVSRGLLQISGDYLQRGRRDSNPQPPDRQAATRRPVVRPLIASGQKTYVGRLALLDTTRLRIDYRGFAAFSMVSLPRSLPVGACVGDVRSGRTARERNA